MQGQRRCCVPWTWTKWRFYLMEWNEFFRNHGLSYYFDHTESDLVSINSIGEIKFSIGDGDEVRQ